MLTPVEPRPGPERDNRQMDSPFGSPATWGDDDLVAVSREFDPDLVLAGYRHGIFPMPVRRRLMGWWSPLDRAVLPLDGMRVPRSLRKMQSRYEVRFDTAFEEVLDACADPRRPSGWISADIRRVYLELHRLQIVHSVESWTPDGQLAGGLYGVGIGGLFAGESMFHRPDIGRDASKVALIGLVELLNSDPQPDRLLDVQWRTDHLASLGVVEIGREEYLRRLSRSLQVPEPDWTGDHVPAKPPG